MFTGPVRPAVSMIHPFDLSPIPRVSFRFCDGRRKDLYREGCESDKHCPVRRAGILIRFAA